MITAAHTSPVPCPVCGDPANLTVTNEFEGGADARRRGTLVCANDCRPSPDELAHLMTPTKSA
jgi:hypothetical protein